MSWASTPTQGRPPFFFGWSFEHQLNSSSRTLSETIGKWIFLMWGVGTLSGAVITDNTTKLKISIPMWPTVPLLQKQQNGTMCHFFWNKEKYFDSSTLVYIYLHSSSDSSTLVYTCLVTRLHSCTFVDIPLWLGYIRLHSSGDSSVFLE